MEYYINEPYPSIDNLDMNIAYGQILLSNIGGLQCEMNAVSLYFYNHVILEPVSYTHLKQMLSALSFIISIAFPIAIACPTVSNISTSFGPSPKQ